MTKKLKKQLTELIIFAGIVLWCVFNYKLFFDFINFILKLAMPIIVGIAIAFMLFDIIITGVAEELFLMRMAVEHNIDIKNKEVAESMYEKIYGNPKAVAIIDKFWGNKRMILTFPNITLRTKAGEIVHIRDLLPDIKPYFFKFEVNRIKKFTPNIDI